MRHTIAVAVAILALGVISPVQAQEEAPTTVNNVIARQAQVQTDVNQVQAALSGIIDEFKRNGMGDAPDVVSLETVRDSIGNLSSQQIAQVLVVLGRTRNAASGDAPHTDLVTALALQQSIALEMQKIVIQLQQQADLMNISSQFAALAQRENVNFKASKVLAANTRRERLTSQEADELSIRQIEQDSIGQEVNARMDRLMQLLKAPDADPAMTAQLTEAFDRVSPSGLRDVLRSTASTLRQARLFLGSKGEDTSYHLLREFARLTKPQREPPQIIQDTITQLTGMIANYPAMIDKIAQTQADEKLLPHLALADQQDDVLDDTTDIGADVHELAPEASATLAEAVTLMKQGVSHTNSLTFGSASNEQKQALEKLKEALEELKKAKQTMKPKPKKDKEPKPQVAKGPDNRGTAEGAGSKFSSLPKRDQDAIRQSESEKLPPQYSDYIQQYRMNIAEDSSGGAQP